MTLDDVHWHNAGQNVVTRAVPSEHPRAMTCSVGKHKTPGVDAGRQSRNCVPRLLQIS